MTERDRHRGVPPEVARLVDELLAAELLDVARWVADCARRCRVGASNARANGAPAAHVREGLDLAEAFSQVQGRLTERVRVLTRAEFRPVVRPTTPPSPLALFDLEQGR